MEASIMWFFSFFFFVLFFPCDTWWVSWRRKHKIKKAHVSKKTKMPTEASIPFFEMSCLHLGKITHNNVPSF
jgi:hypothetical protein